MSFIESFLFAVKEHLGNETTSITTASGLTSTSRTWSLECELKRKILSPRDGITSCAPAQGDKTGLEKEKISFHVIWGDVLYTLSVFVLVLHTGKWNLSIIGILLAIPSEKGVKRKKITIFCVLFDIEFTTVCNREIEIYSTL